MTLRHVKLDTCMRVEGGEFKDIKKSEYLPL